jgi:hypothetical protein
MEGRIMPHRGKEDDEKVFLAIVLNTINEQDFIPICSSSSSSSNEDNNNSMIDSSSTSTSSSSSSSKRHLMKGFNRRFPQKKPLVFSTSLTSSYTVSAMQSSSQNQSSSSSSSSSSSFTPSMPDYAFFHVVELLPSSMKKDFTNQNFAQNQLFDSQVEELSGISLGRSTIFYDSLNDLKDSYRKLHKIATSATDDRWLSSLDSTKWLDGIQHIFQHSYHLVQLINSGTSVFLSCFEDQFRFLI